MEKFIGDAVVAFFGAPVARENDPERAVRAALAIRDWIAEEEKLQVRISVNTGEALVNLAARPEAGEGRGGKLTFWRQGRSLPYWRGLTRRGRGRAYLVDRPAINVAYG